MAETVRRMMRTLDARPFGLLGALLAGAALALAVMAAAGSDPAVWVAVAGAALAVPAEPESFATSRLCRFAGDL